MRPKRVERCEGLGGRGLRVREWGGALVGRDPIF